jgi:CheY-like chemotaxis protein
MPRNKNGTHVTPHRTILLVEDDPNDYRLMQRAFDKAELTQHVVRVANGDDAVSYIAGEEQFSDRDENPLPALMLLDIKLPRRSGFEVLSFIRKRKDPICRLPIVMLSASRQSVDVNKAYELGANSYLTKPDTIAELHQIVASIKEYWLTLNEQPDLRPA